MPQEHLPKSAISTSTPPEQLRATGTHSTPQTLTPSDIELVEQDDVLTTVPETLESNPQPAPPAVRRNPPRERQPPRRYADSVYH